MGGLTLFTTLPPTDGAASAARTPPQFQRPMMRQIAGAFAQYEKARLVHKLKVARDRKKALTGKCSGRKSHVEKRPEVVQGGQAPETCKPIKRRAQKLAKDQ